MAVNMSFETTINFDNASSFQYDSSKVSFDGTKASLKLIDLPNQVYIEDFNNDTDFVYDPDKSFFEDGKLKQKDQRPSGATAYFPFQGSLTSAWNEGEDTSVLNIGTIESDRLDLPPNLSYFELTDIGDALAINEFCIRFTYIPKYSGNPASNVGIFATNGTGESSLIQLVQDTASAFRLFVRAANNSIIVNGVGLGTVVFTAGQEYVFEFYQIMDGANTRHRLFVNGVATSGQNSVGASVLGQRDSIRFGNYSTTAFSGNANFSIKDLVIFNTVQHFVEFDTELPYTYPLSIYAQDKITIPRFTKTGSPLAGILSMDSVSVVTQNDVGFTLKTTANEYYYNTEWLVSDGSYAQSSLASSLFDNYATFPLENDGIVDILVHFPSQNVQSWIDQFSFEYTTQEYSQNITIIYPNSTIAVDDVITFLSTFSECVGANVRFTLEYKGVRYYYDGLVWSVSDNTESKLNTLLEIQDNIAIFDFSDGGYFRPVVYLYSDDGFYSSNITSINYAYDFFAIRPDDINECVVYCFIDDFIQERTDFSDAYLKVELKNAYSNGSKVFLPCIELVQFDDRGYAELSISETSTVNKKLTFTINYKCNGVDKTISFKDASIPNQASANLLDITRLIS